MAVNLGVVALVATAFLHTGETKYREWIAEYMGAWLERTRANGNIVPDNVGPNGLVGEKRDGQWWGGLYGWTGRYGHNMMIHAITAAAEAAQLVTGDPQYLDLMRMHLDCLIEHGREDGGRLLVPHKHTDAGWGEFGPICPDLPLHLWSASLQDADWGRIAGRGRVFSRVSHPTIRCKFCRPIIARSATAPRKSSTTIRI